MEETKKDGLSQRFNILQITRQEGKTVLQPAEKLVVAEISLKILVNGVEYAALLCLDQYLEELALGFLYSEGCIDSYDDVLSTHVDQPRKQVFFKIRDDSLVHDRKSIRSIASSGGKSYTSIDRLGPNKIRAAESSVTFPLTDVLDIMKDFETRSEIFREIGGVHSVMYQSEDFSALIEDIGRHNCVDKITGILLKTGRLSDLEKGIMFISGRVSSEIMTKIIRIGVPILVSRSTPTAAAVTMAEDYQVTLLGYVRGNSGNIYAGAARLTV